MVDLGAVARVAVVGDGVRVGAGARLGDVNAALAGRGLGVPTGLCPSVGIAGLALGGGLGLASRAYGATCDRLTGATVVTPDGTSLAEFAGTGTGPTPASTRRTSAGTSTLSCWRTSSTSSRTWPA